MLEKQTDFSNVYMPKNPRGRSKMFYHFVMKGAISCPAQMVIPSIWIVMGSFQVELWA